MPTMRFETHQTGIPDHIEMVLRLRCYYTAREQKCFCRLDALTKRDQSQIFD